MIARLECMEIRGHKGPLNRYKMPKPKKVETIYIKTKSGEIYEADIIRFNKISLKQFVV